MNCNFLILGMYMQMHDCVHNFVIDYIKKVIKHKKLTKVSLNC